MAWHCRLAESYRDPGGSLSPWIMPENPSGCHPGWETDEGLVRAVEMFHAIWKPCAVCRLHCAVCRLRGHRFNELHARVCFGEITSKKTERIVMIL